ncbi:phage tail protein, partial [Xenorhabdus vietnamensis]|uniref:phage tail protein n=1 Tax=Xenorhabdus vietnamensis TaxID=351656 RepID=UPI001ABEF4E6
IKPSQSDDTQLAEAIRKIIQKSVPHASTTQSGTVQLSNAIYSDSQTEAATSYAVRQVFDSADARLLKKLNGEDIPDKPQFVKNLGLEVTIEKARRAVPDNRRINGKWLSTDITLDASDVDAVSASKGGTIQGDIRVSEGVYIGKQRPDLVLSSLGTAKSRVNLSLWGI